MRHTHTVSVVSFSHTVACLCNTNTTTRSLEYETECSCNALSFLLTILFLLKQREACFRIHSHNCPNASGDWRCAHEFLEFTLRLQSLCKEKLFCDVKMCSMTNEQCFNLYGFSRTRVTVKPRNAFHFWFQIHLKKFSFLERENELAQFNRYFFWNAFGLMWAVALTAFTHQTDCVQSFMII